MKMNVMTIHVDDQAKAHRFYCEVLGYRRQRRPAAGRKGAST
jgi:catechol 2,3-dioxygenase-like lactoylglutathione lyase family enzyme